MKNCEYETHIQRRACESTILPLPLREKFKHIGFTQQNVVHEQLLGNT